MSISSALSNAASGLSATALRASLTSNNIANANTPGYVRRDTVLQEGAFGGVISLGVTRSADTVLTADRRIAEASVNRADVVANTNIQFSRALGDPESGYGLFSTFQRLEQAMTELSVTPESASLQSAVVYAGRDVATELNSLNQLVIDQRNNADKAIAEGVRTVNEALTDLKAINEAIVKAKPGSDEVANLQDRQQKLVDEISRFVPVKQVPGSVDNQIHLITREGVFLLNERVHEIEFTQTSNIIVTDSYPTNLSGLSVGGVDITPGGGGNMAVQSGAMAGYFEVRDVTAPRFQQQLDTIATDLISRFESAGDPTLAPGDPGLYTDGGGALNPANIQGLAGRIELSAAVDPDQGGELWRLRDGLNAATEGPEGNGDLLNDLVSAMNNKNTSLSAIGLPGNFSMSEAIAEVNAAVGEARTRSEATVSSAMARADLLSQAELRQTAVDTDQEMQTLLLIEQAYAANARVIQTVNTLMQRLMEI